MTAPETQDAEITRKLKEIAGLFDKVLNTINQRDRTHGRSEDVYSQTAKMMSFQFSRVCNEADVYSVNQMQKHNRLRSCEQKLQVGDKISRDVIEENIMDEIGYIALKYIYYLKKFKYME